MLAFLYLFNLKFINATHSLELKQVKYCINACMLNLTKLYKNMCVQLRFISLVHIPICFISNGIAVPVLESWSNFIGCLQI